MRKRFPITKKSQHEETIFHAEHMAREKRQRAAIAGLLSLSSLLLVLACTCEGAPDSPPLRTAPNTAGATSRVTLSPAGGQGCAHVAETSSLREMLTEYEKFHAQASDLTELRVHNGPGGGLRLRGGRGRASPTPQKKIQRQIMEESEEESEEEDDEEEEDEEEEDEDEEDEDEEDEDEDDDGAGGRVRDDSETDGSMAGESNDDEELDLDERRRRMLEGSLVNENDDDESSSGEDEEGDASSGDEEESESDKFGRSLPPSSREVRRL